MKSPGSKKEYNTSVTYERSLIAPCGMNCGTCFAFMRPVNKCPGCRADDKSKHKACVQCIIKNCDLLRETQSGFCYDCTRYPCQRLKQLDKRYRTKYRTSFLENLMMIKQKGIEYFLDFETRRRTCPKCKSSLSVHRNYCLACNEVW